MDGSTLIPHPSDPSSSSGHDQYALGHLGYAPTTQTTVVTTTTTTTTSFPPLLMRTPRNLLDRDPKQYPLASSPTPAALRGFRFKIGTRTAYFEENEDLEAGIDEFNSRREAIQAGNGSFSSAMTLDSKFETPKRDRAERRSMRPSLLRTGLSPSRPLSKRSTSPVSITEAAEIASLHRKNKRLRTSAAASQERGDHTFAQPHVKKEQTVTPSTPDTEFGEEGLFKVPRSLRGRRPMTRGRAHSGLKSQYTGNNDADACEPDSPELADPVISGVAATPPIAESDLEPVGPYNSSEQARLSRPTALDTLVAQDAALPSPSLSPITAAAGLVSHASAGAVESFEGEEEDTFSNLDLSQDTSLTQLNFGTQKNLVSGTLSTIRAQSPGSTLMDLPNMIESFDALPSELQTYLMFQFLRRCGKPTLHFIADIVNPALKIDFLSLLPLELSTNIIKYLDVKSMCRAAQVSKKWRQIIDSDETAWKDLLAKDGYELPGGEVERAVKEGWGWQYPHGFESYELDLGRASPSRSDAESTSSNPALSATIVEYEAVAASSTPTNPRKRKASARYSSSKRRKVKSSTTRGQSFPWMRSLESAQGPIAHANAAIVAVPDPAIGMSSLRQMHLYKSIYRRNHSIRKSWMEHDTQPRHFAFQAHGTHVVTCLQFDSDKILTGSDDTKINVFDTKTGACRRTLDGHEGGVWALQYDGNLLVSGSTDRSVRVWDIESGKCLQVFQGHTSTVRCLVILKPTQIGENEDGTPIMMPKQPLIITGSRDSSLRVWKLPQIGEPSVYQNSASANDFENPYFVRVLSGHHHSVRAIAAHGDTLVSGSYDHTVRVWRISTGEVQHRLIGHAQKVYSVVLDHARNRCISGSMDNLVKVWSLETGQCLFNLEGHTSLVGLLDLSHDRLVSAAADSTLRIWDPETGRCKSTLTAHTGAITCFQHDAQKVISGSDRTLKMWNINTGECVRDLLTDLSGVWQVKFNDRRCVAAVQRDHWTYIEVLDFGAARDGVHRDKRGMRTFVDRSGYETEDLVRPNDDNAQ